MILSIDIGGTAVKMGLVDESGAIHARHEASVCYDNYQTPILTTVIREAKVLLEREGVQISGIGVSATGQVDDKIGAVIGKGGEMINKITSETGAEINIEENGLVTVAAADGERRETCEPFGGGIEGPHRDQAG